MAHKTYTDMVLSEEDMAALAVLGLDKEETFLSVRFKYKRDEDMDIRGIVKAKTDGTPIEAIALANGISIALVKDILAKKKDPVHNMYPNKVYNFSEANELNSGPYTKVDRVVDKKGNLIFEKVGNSWCAFGKDIIGKMNIKLTGGVRAEATGAFVSSSQMKAMLGLGHQVKSETLFPPIKLIDHGKGNKVHRSSDVNNYIKYHEKYKLFSEANGFSELNESKKVMIRNYVTDNIKFGDPNLYVTKDELADVEEKIGIINASVLLTEVPEYKDLGYDERKLAAKTLSDQVFGLGHMKNRIMNENVELLQRFIRDM